MTKKVGASDSISPSQKASRVDGASSSCTPSAGRHRRVAVSVVALFGGRSGRVLEHWMHAALLVFLAACSRQEASTQSPAASSATVSASVSAPKTLPSVSPNAVLVQASQVSTCSVSHSCSLSHPGLGSSSHGTGVNLAACTRTSWSSSGPWKSGPDESEPVNPVPSGRAPTPTAAKPTAPTPTPVAPADCARIKSLVASVTAADLEAAHEPAKMDTAACHLYVECGAPPAKAFDVQRQTMTGKGHVVELIRAVYGQP